MGLPTWHSDCLSWESGPWEPPHDGHPPGTYCGQPHRPPLRSQAVGCQEATVEELAEEDLVEGCP